MPLTVVAIAALAATVSQRAVLPDDTYRLRAHTALEIAADGKHIAYTIERADEEDDTFRRELWVADAAGKNAKRLCAAEDDCTSPKFSRDGSRLAYLSDRKDGRQLWVARTGDGRGRAVTAVDESIGDFDWSPDGAHLVFEKDDADVKKRAPGAPSPHTRAKENGGDDDEDDTAPWVIKRTQIQQDGGGFLGDRRTHLWVVPVSGGRPRQITTGAYDDAHPRWSPAGGWIAFVSNRGADPDADDDTDIWLVKPEGGAVKRIAGNPGPDEAPEWSHAGDRIAFVGALRPNDYYQTNRLMVVPLDGGPACDLTAKLDNWVAGDNFAGGSGGRAKTLWSPDDATLYVLFERRGANWVAAIASGGGEPREVLGGAKVYGLVRLSPDGRRLYFTTSTPETLSDLWVAGSDGSGATKLQSPNAPFFAERTLSKPIKLGAKNAAGDTVESWLYPPIGLDPAKKHPLILYIHGGPQEFDGEYFDTGLENQIFPGKGWAVLRVNYRGSTSYGEAFCRSIYADWHTREYEDLMLAVDDAIAKHSWIDAGRLGVGGWSYGGIMTVWIAGHTNRFKVGVPERFEIDYLSCFGTDQWQAQYLTELGKPWEAAELYRTKSPGTYVTSITTPLFLIANENDRNCPPTQAMQLYQRLKLMGMNTELVIYPDEGHTMSTPSHYVDRLYRLIDWFGRYLK